MTRILVVEDSPTQAEHLRQALVQHALDVVCASDGAAALAAMADDDFDLVLTDVTMPGVLDGVGLLRALRADPATATLPVVLLSARADEEARIEGLAAGADDYIVKPFAARELLARIDGAIRLARLRHEVASQAQELQIARAQVKLSLVMDAAKMGEVIYNFATGAVTHSSGFAALLGCLGDGPLSMDDIRERHHPDSRDDVLAIGEARGGTGAYFQVEHRVAWPDGTERWLDGRGHITRDAAGEPLEIMSVYMDVTEEKATQQRVEGLQAQVAHAGRLSELGRMSAVIAHELTQPLTAAKNFLAAGLRLTDEDAQPVEQLRATLGKAEAQVTRAGEILQRIRGFAGKGDSTREPADLASLIEEAAEIARLDPRRRAVELRLDTPSGLPEPVVDRVQIQQVLLNLLRNAFEAVEPCAAKSIEVSASTAMSGGLEVRVADSGPGLSAGVMATLFEPFITTKADGMGVGLSVCREIVEAHGGRMWAEAEGGPGAVFRFTLPLDGPVQRATPAPAHLSPI